MIHTVVKRRVGGDLLICDRLVFFKVRLYLGTLLFVAFRPRSRCGRHSRQSNPRPRGSVKPQLKVTRGAANEMNGCDNEVYKVTLLRSINLN